MVGKGQKRLILSAILLIFALPLAAQSSTEPADSVVRYLYGDYLKQFEENGQTVRTSRSCAFLHNGTYLICDSVYWYYDDKIINCYGNVQLMQGESVLTSDRLDYLIDQDLAQFRGGVVQLRNKQNNLLRTHILDYNTKDSLAVFHGGAAMMSEDGQIIESDDGSYSNAVSLFTFTGDVNMFTDSVFVRTTLLDYDSDAARADFRAPIDFWKDGNMLSAGSGWYERNAELFFFEKDVHGLGSTQESWSDSLYFYRNTNDIRMLGNIQIQDQSRKVAAMGDRLHYVDSLARVTLEERASAALWDGEGEHPDTTYLGATRFVYHTEKMCDIPEAEIQVADARLEEMMGDPVSEYRRRAAQEAADAAARALKDDPILQAQQAAQRARSAAEAPSDVTPDGPQLDTLTSHPGLLDSHLDSHSGLDPESHTDSLAVQLDTLPPPPDTTKVGFLLATGDIRIFRKDMQVRCDSLRYSDLDSIARLYKDPVVWNEVRRQYNSDSLFVLIRGNKMERANLMSNAFIHTEEPGGYFDQIKSTDVIAYFSDSTALKRFDALGGVTALFYLEENDVIATANKSESKMMMATFDEEGNVDHVYNFDNPKSDAYPVAQLPASEQKLKGFNWQPDRRPKDKFDVTSMVVRDSEREAYEARPQAEFRQTERYFPGHMKEVYAALDAAKAKKNTRQSEESPVEMDTLSHPGLDPGSHTVLDSLAVGVPGGEVLSEAKSASADQPGPGTLTEEESERDLRAAGGSGDTPPPSSLHSGLDSLSHPGLDPGSHTDSPRDTTWMSPRELRRALRIAKRDARWAALDQRDADKAARREARKAERKARRDARVAAAEARQAEIDAAKLQKYIERYQKQKERHERRKQKSEPAGERPPGIETGRELPAPAERE